MHTSYTGFQRSHLDGPILSALRHAAGRGGNDLRDVELIAGNRFVTFENFLSLRQVNDLTCFALSRERAFHPSCVMGSGSDAPIISAESRRSRVLYNIGDFRPVFLNHLLAVLNSVFVQLRITPFTVTAIDVQLTATNDGGFFRPHTDNSNHPILRNRRISFTYFFHNEPVRFSGSELCLYKSRSNEPLHASSSIKIATSCRTSNFSEYVQGGGRRCLTSLPWPV
jgi:hypothetical protein